MYSAHCPAVAVLSEKVGMIAGSGAAGERMKLHIGTYTIGTESKGIYRLNLNETGELSMEGVCPHAENPSYLVSCPGTGLLHAVSEIKEHAAVSTYRMDDGGRLSFQQRVSCEGSDLCHLSILPGSALLGSCYGSGGVFHASLDQHGVPEKASLQFRHSPVGAAVHGMSHAHCVVPDPLERYAVEVNLGLDRLFVYRFDNEKLILQENKTVSFSAGEGPRHVVFHPDLPFAYVNTEYGNQIHVYRYQAESGTLTHVQCVGTLPSNADTASFSADMHISSDGAFLLVSNRGHNSIGCFLIDQEGLLHAHGHISSFGLYPRSFALLDDDRYLVIANQYYGMVVTLPFCKGMGSDLPISICRVPSPSCICPV